MLVVPLTPAEGRVILQVSSLLRPSPRLIAMFIGLVSANPPMQRGWGLELAHRLSINSNNSELGTGYFVIAI
jgi:hypothetical protein